MRIIMMFIKRIVLLVKLLELIKLNMFPEQFKKIIYYDNNI